MKQLSSFVLMGLMFSFANAFAAGGGKSIKGDGTGWIGFGAGSSTFYDPKHKFDSDGSALGTIGIQSRLWKSQFILTFSVNGTLFGGTRMDYDYTGADAINYKDPEMDFSGTTVYGAGGLKIRFVDTKVLGMYVEGGGLFGGMTLNYATNSSSAVFSAGTTYQSTQKDIYIGGNYIEAGIELMPFGSAGIRLAGRLATIKSRTIHAIDESDVKWQDAHGYLAWVGGLN